MPISRPAKKDEPTPDPITIDRANVSGMTPGEAHAAVLGALHAGEHSARSARGMVDDAVIDAAVAALTATLTTCEAHAPYGIPGEVGTWCLAEDTNGPPWPCPAYRAAAATIADGLTR